MQRQTQIEHDEAGRKLSPPSCYVSASHEEAPVVATPQLSSAQNEPLATTLPDYNAATEQQAQAAYVTVDRHLTQFASFVRARRRLHLLLGFFGLGMFLSLFVMGAFINPVRAKQKALLQQEMASQRRWLAALQAQPSHPNFNNYLKPWRTEAERQPMQSAYDQAVEQWSRAVDAASMRADLMKTEENTYRLERHQVEEELAPFEAIQILLGLLSFAGVAGVVLAGAGVETKQRRLAHSLAETEDLRVIGPLAEALAPAEPPAQSRAEQALGWFALGGVLSTSPIVTERKLRDNIVIALSQLLPRLQPDDARQLTEEQRTCLVNACFLMDVETDADLIVAIMQTFVKIEDGRLLPVVQRLAELEGRTAAGARVKATAVACLPVLQECAARERQSTSLLRASDAAEPSGDALLRAANDAPATDPTVLLRPTPLESRESLL